MKITVPQVRRARLCFMFVVLHYACFPSRPSAHDDGYVAV
jgi:hypothetical protein